MCLGYGCSILVYRQLEMRRLWGRKSWFDKEALPFLSQWQVTDHAGLLLLDDRIALLRGEGAETSDVECTWIYSFNLMVNITDVGF